MITEVTVRKPRRNAGVELLRMFAALGVVYGHFFNEAHVLPAEMDGGGQIINNLRLFTFPAVDIFVVITGYFLCLNNKRTVGKLSTLVFQTAFVYLSLFVVKYVLSRFYIDFDAIIPVKWFLPLYVTLYCISPYINASIAHLDSKQFTYLIAALLFFFSILPVLNEITRAAGLSLGLSTVSSIGSNAGYSIVNFVVVYCVGAYIRINELHKKVSYPIIIAVIIGCFIFMKLQEAIPYEMTPFNVVGWYDNIFVILLTASFLLLALKVKIADKTSKVIVNLAKANFICYLAHYAFIKIFPTHEVLIMPTFKALSIIIMFCFAVYAGSYLLWLLYNLLFGKITKKLDAFVFFSDGFK